MLIFVIIVAWYLVIGAAIASAVEVCIRIMHNRPDSESRDAADRLRMQIRQTKRGIYNIVLLWPLLIITIILDKGEDS